jgi:hypothetical protein
MISKNLQQFMMKQAQPAPQPQQAPLKDMAVNRRGAFDSLVGPAPQPQQAPLEIKRPPEGLKFDHAANNGPIGPQGYPRQPNFTATELAQAQYPRGYSEGAQGKIWRPVAPGYTGEVDPGGYRLYEDPNSGYYGGSSPGEPGEPIPLRGTGERVVPRTVEVDPRPPEQFAEGWAPEGVGPSVFGAGERSTRRSVGDYSGSAHGSPWGDSSRRRIAFDQSPNSQNGYTRVRQRVPGGPYDARRDPASDYRTGRDPGGNRIFMDPETGMEHWVPEGGEAPQFHREDRKSTNRDRTEANVDAAGKFRMSDVWKNLW